MTDTLLPSNRFAAGEFRVGRVLSRTMSVFSRNLLPFCLVTAIASLPNLLLFPSQTGQVPTGGSFAWIALSWLVGMMLNALSQAIVLYGAFEDMRGRPVDLAQSTRVGLRRLLPVLGVAIFVAIATGLATILLVIPGLIVFTMLFVAMPVCIVEGLGPWNSMGRSADLTKGHRWKIFGLLLLVFLVLAIVGGILGGIIGFAIAGGVHVGGGYVLGLVAKLIWGALWGAFYSILVVVTYHDLRVAKEGVDTDQIAAVFD